MRCVDQNGEISYHGQHRKVGRALLGHRVGLRPTQTDGVMEIIFLTHVIKELDLRQPTPKP